MVKYEGCCLFIDGLGKAPESFWDIAARFRQARPTFYVLESSHERDDFWTAAEACYANSLPIFYVGHSLGGSIVAALSAWVPLDRICTIDAVWPDWIGDAITGDESSLQPLNVRLAAGGRACSFTRKQGRNNRLMPGVPIAGWPSLEIDAGHNQIIAAVADDVLAFLMTTTPIANI